MNRKLLISGILLLCCAVLAGLWSWHALPEKDRNRLVLYGNVDVRQVDLGFRVGGRIEKVLVEEGETVRAGTELARLDADLLTQARDQAVAAYEVEKANLKRLERGYRTEEIAQARAQVAQAQASATNAAENYRRVNALRSQNAVSQREYDNARATEREARARLRQMQDNLRMLSSGYREEEILAQKASLAVAEASLRRAEIELADAVLLAPEKGVILTRARESGAIVQPGQTVYTLTLTEPVWLRVYVEEPWLGRIRPGMPVKMAVDAAKGQLFDGHVGFIAPDAEFTPKTVETMDVRTHLVYRVRIVAEDPENLMRQGMPVTVYIDLDK